LEWDLPDQVKEADRDQGEDEATAGEWAEAEQPPVPEESASALPAEPQRLTRPASRVISLSVPGAGQVWRGSRGAHSMVISIASGKGGTGKTSVAVSLALSLGTCQFLDCDVEEPNASLFLRPSIDRKISVGTLEPWIDESKCSHCGECSSICAYHAIAAFEKNVLLFPALCHGCGGCILVCPEKAIAEGKRNIGVIEEGKSNSIAFIQGILNIGEHMATPVIKDMKRLVRKDMHVIIDSPPGTSCPVVESIKGSDFVLLVTEPTPFGLNDLKLAVDVVRELKIPFGVVINCDGIGDDRVKEYCQKENIPLLLSIPWSREIAEAYSRGIPAVEARPDLKEIFRSLFQEITRITESKRDYDVQLGACR
jgi:MinD superfamily P-loop ATPase